jgi:probable HAF family extracellular repeat protein
MKHPPSPKFLLPVLLLFVWLTLVSPLWAASFQGLDTLDHFPSFSSAVDISGDGSTAVGQSYSVIGVESVRWILPSSLPQRLFPSRNIDWGGTSRGVSHDGNVVVGWDGKETFDSIEAWRWTATTGRVGLGGTASMAQDANADGSVIVGVATFLSGRQAFRWTNSTGIVELGDLLGGDVDSSAKGVSDDGNVIVGAGTSVNGQEAFRWTSGTGMVGLGDLSGGIFESDANDIRCRKQKMLKIGCDSADSDFLLALLQNCVGYSSVCCEELYSSKWLNTRYNSRI